MRKLIWLILLLAGLYAGYWFVGARLLDGQIRALVADERAAGRQLDYEELRVQGFPSRFDIHARQLRYDDPARGLGWTVPEFQIAALSYQPQHYIAIWPQSQSLRIAGQDLAVGSDGMRASVVFSPGPSFVLDRVRLNADKLRIMPADPALGIGARLLRLATDRAAGTEFGHRIGLELQGLELPPALISALGAQAGLPGTIERLHLDAVVDFDARIDRHALRGTTPQPTALRLADLTLDWGPAGLTMAGDLDIDRAGLPEGSLRMTLRGWRRVLAIAVDLGLVPAGNRRMVETTLALLSGGSEDLSMDLAARDGSLYLGPVPLGRAPRLRLE